MAKGPKRVSNNGAMAEIAGKRPFKANSMSGVEGSTDTGYMSPLESIHYKNANPNYTVKSYGTPIAWHTESGGWHVSDSKYSSTTSRHQSLARRATNFQAGHEGARA